jgi:hypothetical protein
VTNATKVSTEFWVALACCVAATCWAISASEGVGGTEGAQAANARLKLKSPRIIHFILFSFLIFFSIDIFTG